MSMPQERRAAVALLIGVVAPLLFMGCTPPEETSREEAPGSS